MEKDENQNKPTSKAEVVPTKETPRAEQSGDSAAHVEVKDFLPAPPSQEYAVPEERDDFVQGGQESAASSLAGGVGPGFVDVDGDVGGSGHNETEVDIFAVPCPGADPVQTWTYNYESYSDYSVSCDGGSRSSFHRPKPWVTMALRKSASIARVFLYRHRALEDGMTLQSLSEDLLDQVDQIRNGAVGAPAIPCSTYSADFQTSNPGRCFSSVTALAA